MTSAVKWSHQLLRQYLNTGDRVIDATAGNGYDTLFLSQCVLPGGTVYAFDIQEEALANTSKRLLAAGVKPVGYVGSNVPADRDLPEAPVILFNKNHREMAQYVQQKVNGVVFNLGYLPGGDHQIITNSESTIEALNSAVELLQVGGIIVITVYTGHQDARQESQAVDKWVHSLPQKLWESVRLSFPNRHGNPPYILGVCKKGENMHEKP